MGSIGFSRSKPPNVVGAHGFGLQAFEGQETSTQLKPTQPELEAIAADLYVEL